MELLTDVLYNPLLKHFISCPTFPARIVHRSKYINLLGLPLTHVPFFHICLVAHQPATCRPPYPRLLCCYPCFLPMPPVSWPWRLFPGVGNKKSLSLSNQRKRLWTKRMVLIQLSSRLQTPLVVQITTSLVHLRVYLSSLIRSKSWVDTWTHHTLSCGSNRLPSRGRNTDSFSIPPNKTVWQYDFLELEWVI